MRNFARLFFQQRRFRRQNILAHESVQFFPTFGRFDPVQDQWELSVHGWIYRPVAAGRLPWQRFSFRFICGLLGITSEMISTPLFRERATPFLVPNEKGKRLSIEVGGKTFPLSASSATGHFHGTIALSRAEIAALSGGERPHPERPSLSRGGVDEDPCRIPFHALTPPDDPREFNGEVRLIPARGLSVISDIDDTIKETDVENRRAMIQNTFLRDFAPVEGMADVYRGWADAGAVFHYVSASPWQLFHPLSAFLERHRFPEGTFHLKPVRLRNTGWLRLLSSSKAHKRRIIKQIFTAFPQRRFLMVGDSGQRDPETYSWFARRYPRQVAGVYIRALHDEPASSRRFRRAFQGLPSGLVRLFKESTELPKTL